MKNLEDREIVALLKSRSNSDNDQAFKELYIKSFDIINKLILNNSGLREDAEDVFQDALIVLFNKIKSGNFELNSTLQTYLYSVSRNIWLKKLRKTKRKTDLTDVILDNEIIIDENLVSMEVEEKTASIAKLLDSIGDDCKRLLMMYYYQRMRMNEIAVQMSFANDQVAKNKKSRCMKKLREKALASNILNLL